jgi:hypothetical protein
MHSRFRKVGGVVGPEIQAGVVTGIRRQPFKELRSQEPVLVVAAFGPWVGKKEIDGACPHLAWKDIKEKTGLGAHKMKIRKAGPLLLSLGALDALKFNVDPDT